MVQHRLEPGGDQIAPLRGQTAHEEAEGGRALDHALGDVGGDQGELVEVGERCAERATRHLLRTVAGVDVPRADPPGAPHPRITGPEVM